ncbi:MAG: nuclear transport factor 2 family protein [Planctomycetes bacterium]|nr:nuclear transport factor 2 family protein [Planctomycetota bacterium]
MTTAADLAQRQLDAYNAHDIEAFVACFAEDVVVADVRTGAVIMQGREAMHARYGALFARPALHAALVSRTTLGDDVVLDVERVAGLRDDGGEVDAVAIYERRGDVIARVWFVRP